MENLIFLPLAASNNVDCRPRNKKLSLIGSHGQHCCFFCLTIFINDPPLGYFVNVKSRGKLCIHEAPMPFFLILYWMNITCAV